MISIYNLWLPTLKLRLSISDNLRDQILLDYLRIAHRNLFNNYYEIPFTVENALIEKHIWYDDEVTKMAVIHLAVTYFSNPDENMEATNVKDDRMVIRIIGNRMVY